MLDIIEWIGGVFTKLYTTLDVNIFPDLNVSYIEILIGIILFVVILKLLFGILRDSNLSIGNSVRTIFEKNKRESRK